MRRTVAGPVLLVLLVTTGVAVPRPVTAGPSAADPPSKDLPPPHTATLPANPVGSVDAAGGEPLPGSGSLLAEGLASTLRTTGVGTPVTVEILTTTPDARSQVAAVGGSVTLALGGVSLATLTHDQIRRLASLSTVLSVRTPVERRDGALFAPAPTRGIGGSINNNYTTVTGMGVKVGIIDLFDPSLLSTEVATGDLAVIPPTQRRCFNLGSVCPFGAPGYTHGNAVAEVVADGAPDATLYLAEVGTLADYRLAIDWFAANGVTIVNHSLTGPLDGPGNGTGPSASVVDYAVSKGITWFNAAGNAGNGGSTDRYMGGYWRGTWSDPNSNRWLNFKGSDESLSVYCGALMGVRWSDWGSSRTDYDLYISDYHAAVGTNGAKVIASAANQALGALPLEGNDMRWLCNTNPAHGPVYDTDRDGFVSLWLYRTKRNNAAITGDVIEFMVNNGWFEYSSPTGSAAIPFGDTANPGAASVGSVGSDHVSLDDYSAVGPTNDGRAKPDLLGLGAVMASFATDPLRGSRNFEGTSAASPSVAALAAVGHQLTNHPTPVQTIRWLRDWTGWRAKVNGRGWGYARMDSHLPTMSPPAGRYQPLTPERLLDTRGNNGVPVGVPIGLRPADSGTTLDFSTYGLQPGATVALNVVLVHATAAGYLQAYPWRGAAPGSTATVNVASAGSTRANFTLVTLGADQLVTFYLSSGGHIVVDLVGVFRRLGDGFVPVTPYNVYDSHTCDTCNGAALAESTWADVQVTGTTAAFDASVGIPEVTDPDSPPTAVAVAVTISNVTASGFMSVTPTTVTQFGTANLNYVAGETLTATTFVPVDADTGGKIRVFVRRSAHIRVDVLGYFTSADLGQAGWYRGVAPWRALDTRTSGRLAAGGTTEVDVELDSPVHSSVVVANVTSVGSLAPGVVSTGDTAASEAYRNLTAPKTGVVAGAGSLSRLTATGRLRLHTTSSMHLVADVLGYFTDALSTPVPSTPPITIVENPPAHFQASDIDISDDGEVVVYRASDLTQPVSQQSVRVWRRAAGDTTTVADGDITKVVVSGDGTTVFFESRTAHVPADTNGVMDVYSYDIESGLLQRESLTPAGGQIAVASRLAGASDDAHLVAYITGAQLSGSDHDVVHDVYIRDRYSGTLTFASLGVGTDFSVYTAIINGPASRVVMVAERQSVFNGTDRTLVGYTMATNSTTVAAEYPISGPQGDELVDITDDGMTVLVDDNGRSQLINLATATLYPVPPHPETSSPYNMTEGYAHGSIDRAAARHSVVRSYWPLIGLSDIPDVDHALVMTFAPTNLRKISATWNGTNPTNSVTDAVISDDGNHVAYITWARNTTPTATSQPNIYVVDLTQL